MEQHLADLIHNARRWTENGRDYLPTLGCSACGKGCMPLCGLGLKRRMTPMETKDVVLKSRKTMLETGKTVHPTHLQFVSGTDVVIVCEKALDSIEEREIKDKGKQWVFTKPIPTASGLLCRDCDVCVLCRAPATSMVNCRGKPTKICVVCMDACDMCQQPKARHHNCCTSALRRFF